MICQMTGVKFEFCSLAVWWQHGWFVGLLLFVLLFLSFFAMPGLCCFPCVTQDSSAKGGKQACLGVASPGVLVSYFHVKCLQMTRLA